MKIVTTESIDSGDTRTIATLEPVSDDGYRYPELAVKLVREGLVRIPGRRISAMGNSPISIDKLPRETMDEFKLAATEAQDALSSAMSEYLRIASMIRINKELGA